MSIIKIKTTKISTDELYSVHCVNTFHLHLHHANYCQYLDARVYRFHRYNLCLENGSDQLFVYRARGINRYCIYYIVSQSADPNHFKGTAGM